MKCSRSNSPGTSCAPLQSSATALLLCVGILSATSSVSLADESGISFWLPGTNGSLAAVPRTPGWAVASVYYHTSVSAGADVAAAREIQIGRFNPSLNVSLNASLHARADLALIVPSDVFATPVLGGQLAVQMGTIVGSTSANVNGTLTASLPPFGLVRTDSIGDTVTGFGDLYAYDQVSADSGSGDRVGAFESRVFSAGPQLGYIFPIAGKQGFLGLKSYFEFGAKDRPEGWNTWLTFAISDAPPTPGRRATDARA
jgi:hypothetical protein